jgi:hypothetical protein
MKVGTKTVNAAKVEAIAKYMVTPGAWHSNGAIARVARHKNVGVVDDEFSAGGNEILTQPSPVTAWRGELFGSIQRGPVAGGPCPFSDSRPFLFTAYRNIYVLDVRIVPLDADFHLFVR